MSHRKNITVPRIVTDKIPLRYVDQPEKLNQYFRSFESYIEHVKESRERLDTVSDGFVQGSMSMISGDLKFEQGMHSEGIIDFTNASETFLKTQKLADIQIKEETLELDDRIMRELGRRAVYSQARITHAESLIELKRAKNVTIEERNIIAQFLELAVQSYQEELAIEEETDDLYHKLITKRNIFKVLLRLDEQKAAMTSSINEKRRYLYNAMANAQKAIFLGEQKIPKAYFENTQAKIRDLTIRKFIDRADFYWEKGLEYSSEQDYNSASSLFWSGMNIYETVKKYEDRTEFGLQSKMFNVTALENDAKKELVNDENNKASELFQQSSDLMQVLIKLVKELGNQELVDLFNIQSAYFDGMKLFCTGLMSYDSENYKAALKVLKVSQRSLKAVLTSAREMDNGPLIQSCKDGLKQIETYLETVELLVED